MEDTFKILYVDDSLTQLVAAKRKLEEAGFEVGTASNLAAAKQLLHGCELVILDFFMATLDGAAVLTQLKARLREGHQPMFYLYTSDRATALDYARYKFDGVFARKGEPEELVRQVQNIGKLVRMRRTVQQTRGSGH